MGRTRGLAKRNRIDHRSRVILPLFFRDGGRGVVRHGGTPRTPFNSTPMAVNSIPSGSPHVRCTPMWALSTCGEPGEIKKNSHPKNITALSRDQATFNITGLLNSKAGGAFGVCVLGNGSAGSGVGITITVRPAAAGKAAFADAVAGVCTVGVGGGGSSQRREQ